MNFRELMLESEIDVPHSIANVWAFLSDPQNSALWDKSVAAVEAHGTNPVGVGWTGTTIAPSGVRQEFRIIAWDPTRRFEFELLESRIFRRASLEFTLAEVGNLTRITHRIQVSLRSPLLYPLLKLTSGRALAADLESLRAALDKAYPRSRAA